MKNKKPKPSPAAADPTFRIYDCPTRIYVRYNRASREHLVDLVENSCECEDFAFRVAVEQLENPEARCKHLTEARKWLAVGLEAALAKCSRSTTLSPTTETTETTDYETATATKLI